MNLFFNFDILSKNLEEFAWNLLTLIRQLLLAPPTSPVIFKEIHEPNIRPFPPKKHAIFQPSDTKPIVILAYIDNDLSNF